MQVPANRAVVIISGLLTLLVLGGGAMAVGLRNGLVRFSATEEAVPAAAQPGVATHESVAPLPAEGPPPEVAQAGPRDEAAVYRQKLDEAYRALDDAYAQIRALQSPGPQFAVARDDDRRRDRHDDDDEDDRRERRPGQRDAGDRLTEAGARTARRAER